MARTTVLTRLAGALAVAVAVVAVVLVAAEPAQAADVKVELRTPNSFTIGGWGRSVNVNLTEDGDGPMSVQGRFVFQLDGLTADAVRISRNGQQLKTFGEGTVGARDERTIELGDGNRRTIGYQVSFGENAPEGRVRISYEVTRNNQVIGSDHRDADVRGGRGGIFNPPRPSEPPKTTPPNTDPGVIRTFTAGETYNIAPIDQAASSTSDASGVPTSFYWMGAVLLAVGGVILWLLFRRQGEPTGALVATGSTAEYPLIHQPMPRSGSPLPRRAMHQPTTVLPTVRNPQVPPHQMPPHPAPPHQVPPHAAPPHQAPGQQLPADPWAGQPGQRPGDRPRGFDPFDGTP